MAGGACQEGQTQLAGHLQGMTSIARVHFLPVSEPGLPETQCLHTWQLLRGTDCAGPAWSTLREQLRDMQTRLLQERQPAA